MKHLTTTLLLTGTLLSTSQLLANENYWVNSYGEDVKTGFGECWAHTDTDTSKPCGSMPEKKVEKKVTTPPPVVKAPAPVVKAPAPVVKAPAPAVEPPAEPVIKEVINLKGVSFKTGSDVINSSSYARLDISVADLKNNPDLNVIVAGHTDNVGNADLNRKLSLKRAEAVEAYLVNKGIDKSRLTARGFGDSEPASSNDTAVGRALNRRVELRVH